MFATAPFECAIECTYVRENSKASVDQVKHMIFIRMTVRDFNYDNDGDYEPEDDD